MLGLLNDEGRKATEKLWETKGGSLEKYWEGMSCEKYHTDRIARQLEYTDYSITYKYLKALLAEATAVFYTCPSPNNQLDMAMADNRITLMKHELHKMYTSVSHINDTIEDLMGELLEYKKRFLVAYVSFLDYMDNLSMSVRQKVQVIEGQGTYLHSSCYLGTGDNTLLVFQQRMTDLEVFFKYER